MTALSTTAAAESKSEPFTIDYIEYVIVDNEYAEITNVIHCDYDYLTLPSSINHNGTTYAVKKISEYALSNCQLTSITIPSSVTDIENNPFQHCISLDNIFVDNDNPKYTDIDGVLYDIDKTTLISCPTTRINCTIPDSVTTIGDHAFANCKVISITLPNSVTTIDNWAFNSCYDLNTITIPTSVKTIGSFAFIFCKSLRKVTIPYSVSEIGDNPFCNCSSLENISVMGTSGCQFWAIDGILYNVERTKLIACPGAKKECIIGPSVETIGNRAFGGCNNLVSVNLPNSVTTIGTGAFASCNKLQSISLPNSVTTIGSDAFIVCISLDSIIIPNSVTTIGARAFWCCHELKSLYLGNSIHTIDEMAFAGCPLKTIHTFAQECPVSGNSAFFETPADAVVYVPKESLESYQSGWSEWFSDFRILGGLEINLNTTSLEMNIGDTQHLIATITKEDDVPIVSESWESSNPAVSTVENGKVTAVGTGEATITYTAVDGLCQNTYSASCKLIVSELDGINSTAVNNASQQIMYYNLNGSHIPAETLAPGLYIKRQGSKTEKILVK